MLKTVELLTDNTHVAIDKGGCVHNRKRKWLDGEWYEGGRSMLSLETALTCRSSSRQPWLERPTVVLLFSLLTIRQYLIEA